jgi:peptide/nickel transport system substrate-binding protein
VFREGYDRAFSRMDTVVSSWADPSYNTLYESAMIAAPNGQIVPQLADWWKVSADGLTWTIKIRDGLHFHSGAPCTAAEVAANFNAFRDPKIGQNPPFWGPVTGVTTGPHNTVIVKMSHPYEAFVHTLKTEFSYIENLAARKKAGSSYGASVVDGTGPFTLQSFVPADHVQVARWEGYPGSHVPFFQNKGKAYLDAVRWVSIREASNRANEIEAGNVDAIKNPLGQDVPRLKANADLTVLEFQELSNYCISVDFKHTQLGFDDVRVRQALSHAIDREAIITSILFGHGVATYGPISSSFIYYEPRVEHFNRYNVDLANALLDRAGWRMGPGGVRQKNGVKLAFEVINNNDTVTNQVLEAIAAYWQKIGVDATPVNLEFEPFLAKLPTGIAAFAFKWLWSSPMDLILLNMSPSFYGHIEIPALQAAFSDWQHANSFAQLKAAASKAQLIAAQQVAYLPIYTPNTIWVHTSKVHGWRPTATTLYPFYNDVWLG